VAADTTTEAMVGGRHLRPIAQPRVPYAG